MVLYIALTVTIILTLTIIGLPVAYFLIKGLPKQFHRISFVFSIAILIAFSFLSISASWSFGIFGNNYFLHFLLISIIFFTFFAWKIQTKGLHNINKLKLKLSRIDIWLFAIVLTSITSNRFFVDKELGLGLRAGTGPDTAQNMMSFIGADKLGATWWDQKSNFLEQVDSGNLYNALESIYTVASFRDQAVYDYLLYGVRWGLSVPASVGLKFFGNENLILFPALITTVSFAAFGIVSFGFLSSLLRNTYLPALISISLVSSGSLIYQTFNGGLAQAWALPGLAALSFTLFFLLIRQNENIRTNKSFLLIAALSWIALAVPYFDAALVLVGLYFLMLTSNLILTKAGNLFGFFSKSILISFLIVLPFSLVALYTIPIRIQLAGGTGILSPNWPLPSEILGIADVWTNPRTSFTLAISILISGWLVYVIFKSSKSKSLETLEVFRIIVGVAISLSFALIASYFSKANNNYIYIKVGAYLSPILLTSIFILISNQNSTRQNPIFQNDENFRFENKGGPRRNYPFTAGILTISILISNQYTVSGFTPQSVFFPRNFGAINVDQPAQEVLKKHNYLLFYTPSSNMLGAFGDVVWVSKAPNDLNLDERLNSDIRVLCFSFNQLCTPPGKRISEPTLEKYGLLSYETSISTAEFAKLKILERYNESFFQVGQKPFQVPERFIGGNPLLK